MENNRQSKSLLINLQICRGLAAALVVVGHALQDSEAMATRLGLPALRSTINWGCGVDIFFVISGFIMVHVAADEFGQPGASGRFLAKRLARIVPLYWLMTTVLIIGASIAPGLLNVPIGNWPHIVASYLFVPDWRPDHSVMRPVMALGWTLNFEMLFYVAFAACMLLPLRQGIAALVFGFGGFVLLRPALGIQQDQLVFWSDPIVLEFLMGVAVGLAWRADWRLPAPLAVGLALLGLALITQLLGDPLGLGEPLNFIRHGAPAMLLVAAASLAPGVPDSWLARFGKSLGDASYALYLSHPFVVRPLREAWLKLGGGGLPLLAYIVFCLVGAVIVALLLHHFVEKPMARALQRLQSIVPSRQNSAPTMPQAIVANR